MSSETPSSSRATASSGLESAVESTETTVPTDLTLSPSDVTSHNRGHPSTRERHQLGFPTQSVTKQAYERKQLLHDLQLIKIELSQKTLLMDSLKAQYMARTEELEEKLADAVHQRQLTQARLESQLQLERDETRRRLDEARVEMDRILLDQKRLEERKGQLEDAATDLKVTLRDIDVLTEDEYFKMQVQDASQLSLRNYIAVKVFEMMWPLKAENGNLKAKTKSVKEENDKMIAKCDLLEEERTRERQQFAQLMSKYNRVVTDLEVAKSEIRSGDYKVENYDKIKSERDKLQQDYLDAKNLASILQATEASQRKELEDIKSERANQKQAASLLEQDKVFFSKRYAESNSRIHSLEERLATVTLQLEKVTQAREDVYERYVIARDFYKSEFDRRLKEELDGIQLKTSREIEALRMTAKEMHEQEIRSLRDARDLALSQREKSEAAERQALFKYERLLDEVRKAQGEDTVTKSSLKSQLTLRAFELEQAKLLHAESQNSCQQLQLENEKLTEKFNVLNEEIHSTKPKLESRILQLESEIKDKTTKLAVYEKLEQELDDVVIQAAEISNDGDGEKLLLSFGQEISVPTTIRRRLQQSFQLAKRILSLEKVNASLKMQLKEENLRVQNLMEEVATGKSMLDKVGQPISDFAEAIRSREDTIRLNRQQITELEKNINLNKEKEEAFMRNEAILQELEKARNNREEVAKMKRLLVTLFPNRFLPSNNVDRNVPSTDQKATTMVDTTRTKKAEHHPKVTIFTKPRKTYKPP